MLLDLLPGRKTKRGLNLVVPLIAAIAASPAQGSQGGVKEPEPVAPLHTLVTADDYPEEAQRSGEQGTVEFLLTIGTDGQPTDCVVTNSSGSSSLDSASCLIMIERARFRPAKNAAGKPVSGQYQNKMVWRLESSRAGPAVDTATSLWFACTWGEAAKLVISELSAAEVVTRAFSACAPLEERIAVEMRKVRDTGLDPSKVIPNLKNDVKEKLPEMLDRSRAALTGGVPK